MDKDKQTKGKIIILEELMDEVEKKKIWRYAQGSCVEELIDPKSILYQRLSTPIHKDVVSTT